MPWDDPIVMGIRKGTMVAIAIYDHPFGNLLKVFLVLSGPKEAAERLEVVGFTQVSHDSQSWIGPWNLYAEVRPMLVSANFMHEVGQLL
ncbi:MAG TPA: hypothetical protein VEA59_04380 [Patescibacteria group bacterium]|nr:hypothetical protein [Patescibacteria group bacterium]